MRSVSQPLREELELANVLHALSDPLRLEIVQELDATAEIACGRLAAPVSKSTLSHHLKVLREAGLTETRVEGTQRIVSLRRADLEARFPGLLRCVLDGARHSTA